MFCNICLFRPLGFGEGEVRAEEDACEDQDATQAQVFAGGERVRADLGEIGIPRKRLCTAEKVDQHLVIPNSVKEVAQHVYLYAVGENCGLCGFSSSQKRGQKRGLRNHVEKHLAFYYPCVFCKYEARTRPSLVFHYHKSHKLQQGKVRSNQIIWRRGEDFEAVLPEGIDAGEEYDAGYDVEEEERGDEEEEEDEDR